MPKKANSSFAAAGEYADEDTIPVLYNFPKEDWEESIPIYADDNEQPYRHITNWFLSKPKEPTVRLPIPTTCKSFRGMALFGELIPSPREVKTAQAEDGEPPPTKKVIIQRNLSWSIDRSHFDRGIWICTSNAWYKLIRPCGKKVKQQNGTALSQEDVHLPMRAKFGLVSNICDMLGERNTALGLDTFVQIYNNRLPRHCHKLLSPTKEIMAKCSGLNSEPFDLELLRRDPAFLSFHLQKFDPNLTQASRFMQGLMDMERARKRNGGLEEPFDYLASAERAENRSKRMPWGSMRPGERYTHINRLIEIKLALKGVTSGAQNGEVDTDTVPTAAEQPPQQKKQKVSPES